MNNYILFLITLFCWSPTWYLIKFQLGYVDPLVSVFYRFLIAAIIIFIYLVIKNKNLKFLVHDMREVIDGESFDCVFNLFTSFGYFENNHENEKVLKGISQMLSPKLVKAVTNAI